MKLKSKERRPNAMETGVEGADYVSVKMVTVVDNDVGAMSSSTLVKKAKSV